MKIAFDIDDDIKISSEEVEMEIGDGAFEIPTDRSKLKPLCKAVAKLRGHWEQAEIERIRVVGDVKASVTKVQAYAYLKDFANYLKEYARACKASGYDGIEENDIDDKLTEYYK